MCRRLFHQQGSQKAPSNCKVGRSESLYIELIDSSSDEEEEETEGEETEGDGGGGFV
jgi:hypothetical protein